MATFGKCWRCPKVVFSLCFLPQTPVPTRELKQCIPRRSIFGRHRTLMRRRPPNAFYKASGSPLGLLQYWQLPPDHVNNGNRNNNNNKIGRWIRNLPKQHQRQMTGILQRVSLAKPNVSAAAAAASLQRCGAEHHQVGEWKLDGTLDLDPRLKFRTTSQKIKKTKAKMKEKMEEIIQRENVFTIPNILCVTRIALSPVLCYLVLNGSYHHALGIFVFAGLTDLMDGMIARNFPSQQSMLGSFLDPMADKLLVASLFLSLTAAEMIPIPLTTLIIARDLCLVGAGFYVRYLSLPPPRTLARYFDVTHATARLSPTFLSKVNTSVQLSLVAFTLAAPVFNLVDHPALYVLWYITAWTTMSSGLSYLCSNDTFQLLRNGRKKLKQQNQC